MVFKSNLTLQKIIKILYKYIAAEEYGDNAWELNFAKDTSSYWGRLVRVAFAFHLE